MTSAAPLLPVREATEEPPIASGAEDALAIGAAASASSFASGICHMPGAASAVASAPLLEADSEMVDGGSAACLLPGARSALRGCCAWAAVLGRTAAAGALCRCTSFSATASRCGKPGPLSLLLLPRWPGPAERATRLTRLVDASSLMSDSCCCCALRARLVWHSMASATAAATLATTAATSTPTVRGVRPCGTGPALLLLAATLSLPPVLLALCTRCCCCCCCCTLLGGWGELAPPPGCWPTRSGEAVG